MGDVKIRYLQADGTYRKGSGDVDGPYLSVPGQKQYHSLIQAPIFRWGKPIQLQSWGEFLRQVDSLKETPSTLDQGAQTVLVEDQSFWPIAAKEGLDANGLRNEINVAYEIKVQRAASDVAHDEYKGRMGNLAFLLLTAVAAVITLLMAIPLVQHLMLRGDGP